ncbi:hypothetical protein [Devosia submarina]|uniref:hypothetical protein n=1 Tax=Devosia submarina TaxID=1173082 RepID=UPI0013001B4E|nr:hypothetical protein [Devosia submarina]
MTERKADHDRLTAAPQGATANRTPKRKRLPSGLMLYGILTALGGLALLVVE